jgi:hypothetical protein
VSSSFKQLKTNFKSVDEIMKIKKFWNVRDYNFGKNDALTNLSGVKLIFKNLLKQYILVETDTLTK